MAKEKYGFQGEYNFYVGILTHENELRLVDTVDYSDKSATWDAGAKPMVFTKQSAIDLQMGLMCDGYKALVIEAPDFLELQNRDAWISVKDRLPIEEAKAFELEYEEYPEFIVQVDRGQLPTTLSYDWRNNEWFTINTALHRETYTVTHWQPYPSPPNER